jgi:hypothetical protein
MADDAQVRRSICLKLEMGILPKSAASRLWAGLGANEVCSACDETVTRKQKLHEWEFQDGKIVMHVECWEIWNEERLRGTGPRREGQ